MIPHQHPENAARRPGIDHCHRTRARRLFNLHDEAKEAAAKSTAGQEDKLMARLRIGSRGSQLALWQAHHISDLLRAKATPSNWRSSSHRR